MFRSLLRTFALAMLVASPAMAAQNGGCMPTTGTYSGLTAAGYINAGFSSALSSNSGASAPANACGGAPLKGQLWLDISNATSSVMKVYDGSQWLNVGTVESTNHLWQIPPFTSQLKATDGSLVNPGISFTNEAGSGLRRAGGGDVRLTVLGTDVITATPTGVSIPNLTGAVNGAVRLVKSGSNLVLQPFGGSLITINGVNKTVPAGGVSLAPTGLTVSTTYYIYAFVSGGAVALEASVTGHSADTAGANVGVEIKTGDASRSLVGVAYTVAGPAWVDTPIQRHVASWFNRRPRSALVSASGNSTTSSTTAGPFPAGLTISFVTWGDSSVAASISSNWDVPDNPYSVFLSPWVDGSTSTSFYGYHTLFAGGQSGNFFASDTLAFTREFPEGYHTIALGTWVNGGSTTHILTSVNSAQVMQ